MTAALAWLSVATFYAALATSLWVYWRRPLAWAVAGLAAAIFLLFGGALGGILFVILAYI